jgi:hypothetical protein
MVTMFKRGWLARGRINSDEGFTVDFIGRSKIRYGEAGRSVDVGGERTPDGFALEPATMSCWSDGALVDDQRKQEIIDRIVAALQSQGMHADIV